MKWRIDSDYKHKLSPEDAAWLEKFEGEYYRAAFGDDPLHSDEQRREILAAQNVAWADAVTQTPDTVAAAQTRPLRRKSDRARYYFASDYPSEHAANSAEDDIVALLDEYHGKAPR